MNFIPCLIARLITQSTHCEYSETINLYIEQDVKDGRTVSCNGSEIIGSIYLKYGKRTACRDNFFTINAGFS